MKSEMRRRYYCDHCKKSGGGSAAMKRHEEGCTLNPNRICRFCQKSGEIQHSAADLIKTLDEKGFKALRELNVDCPACTLVALRQTKQTPSPGDLNWCDPDLNSYNFKSDCEAFWKEWRANNQPIHGIDY